MRKMILPLKGLMLAGLMACAGAIGQQEALASSFSSRFIGLDGLKGKTNLVVFQEVTGLKEFDGFRSSLADRVAATLAKKANADDATLPGLLKPLAGDLIAFETVFEQGAQGTNGGSGGANGSGASNGWSLAIQLPAARHEAWKKGWGAIQKAAKLPGATLSREGAWTLVSNGGAKELLKRAKTPATDVLEVDGDLSMLMGSLPGLAESNGNLRVKSQGTALRTDGKFTFDNDLALNLKRWEIPTNTIREPLIGFTAAQGVSNILAKVPGFKKHTAPNQMFFWSEGVSLFSVHVAAKVDDAPTFVRDFAEDLVSGPMATRLLGRLEFDTNENSLSLFNLPIAIPFLRPGHSNDVNFVYAGAMPLTHFSTNAMPAGLANELRGRTNVVYYDWEISPARAEQWRPVFQTLSFALKQPTPFYTGPAHTWLIAAEGKLRNAVTEVTQTGARELTLTRRSDLGLSSLELFRLAEWITGPPPASANLMPPGMVPGAK